MVSPWKKIFLDLFNGLDCEQVAWLAEVLVDSGIRALFVINVLRNSMSLVCPIYCVLHLLHCIGYMMCFELQLNVPLILMKDLLVMVQCIFRDLLRYFCRKQLLIGQKETESSGIWNGSIVGLSDGS